MDWRQIEAALVAIARDYGFDLQQHSDSGDCLALGAINIGDTIDDLNLTELAKDLARELSR